MFQHCRPAVWLGLMGHGTSARAVVRQLLRPMQISIRSRLLLLVLSVLVPAVAGAAWLVAQTYHAEREANERTLRDTTRALSLVVDREFDQRDAIVRVLALSHSLDDAPTVDPVQLLMFDLQARRAIAGLQGWVVLAAPGRTILDTRLAPGVPIPDELDNAADEALFSAPAVTGLRTVAGSQSHAAVVQPVRRNGHTLLNLAVTVLPAELQHIIDRHQLPPDWVAAVIDNRGVVVARHPGGTAFAGRMSTPEMKARLAAGREGLFHSVSREGNPITGYFSTSSRGWTYVTAMPRPQFAGGMPAAVLQVALGALALLGVATGGAIWVARRIAAPVYALKRAATQIQAGEPVERQATGIVECDDVAAALADASHSLRQARAELQRQVDEAVARTRTAEQRASQSRRVEALGRLTGGVAHDFNNLLGVISNSAYLLQRHASSPDVKVAVAATLRAVEAGGRLTQHLLRFAGRQPVRPQVVELGRLLPDLRELLGIVLGRRIEVQVSVAPDTPPVAVDTGELELALINLALNARDAMPAGGRVRLKAGNAEAGDLAGLLPGRYAVVTFIDDGQGIAPDLLERIFEPFVTTKPAGQGTGLGLSQVHGFCVQAGGGARVASTPGRGTEVRMILPAADPAAGRPPVAMPPLPDSVAGLRVLLVEDNQDLGEVTTALLDAHACKVHHARSPEEALRALESQAGFDVVLSDVVMPGRIDGVRLARLLQGLQPALPVVLISGYSHELPQASEFTVLRKPCSREDLLTALNRAVHGVRPMA